MRRALGILLEQGPRGLFAAIGNRRSRQKVQSIPTIPVRSLSRDDGGVDVLGFFTAEHGVGEAGRVLVATLDQIGVATSTITYTDTQSRTDHPYVNKNESRFRVLICSINAEQMVASRDRLPKSFYRDRYVIGQWFWELEVSPPWYEPAWSMVNELWAPTRFIESMLRRSAPPSVSVTYVPLPVVQPSIDVGIDRSFFEIDNRFLFVFVFDMMSVMKRKNPLGVIEAFIRAFPVESDVQLVIKTMNGAHRPEDLNQLLSAIAGRSDIKLIDTYFSHLETSTLISMADCYVSLHRSEGLGLTLTEAMSLGVPIIATDYSGPTDFLNADNAFLIPWKRVPVGEGAGGYDPLATWAEPDSEAAAEAMKCVVANPDVARAKAARGQRELLDGFTPDGCGAIMKDRLEEIWSLNRGN